MTSKLRENRVDDLARIITDKIPQRLLGHITIDATLHYAMANQATIKNSHRKSIG